MASSRSFTGSDLPLALSRFTKAVEKRISHTEGRRARLRTSAIAFAWAVACASANADVLVLGDTGFVRYARASDLVVFGPRVRLADEVVSTSGHGAPVPGVLIPRDDILDAIHQAGFRYAADRAVAQAGLSATEWVTLFRSNIQIESAFQPDARSHVGAIGLGQLMPGTARELGVDPHDIHQNLDGSARYLLAMLRQFGTPELALAAYNAGPEAVEQYRGIPPYRETQDHVRKVIGVFNKTLGKSGEGQNG